MSRYKDIATVRRAMDSDDDMQCEYFERRRMGRSMCQDVWKKANVNHKFASGEQQWPEEDTDKLKKRKAARLTMNEIGPVLQTLSGRQMMQRFQREYLPRSRNQAVFAEMMTEVDKTLMQAADAEQVESAAFKDGPGIAGISFVRVEFDTLEDPHGRLKLDDYPIWSVIWDNTARKVNLHDMNWIICGSWWSQKEVKRRWPDKWNEIRSMIGTGAFVPPASDENTFTSHIPWENMQGSRQIPVYNPYQKEVWIEYYEYREPEQTYEIGIPSDPQDSYADAQAKEIASQSGQSNVGEGAGGEAITSQTMTQKELSEFKKQRKAAFGEDVPKQWIVPHDQMKYKYAYFCGNTELESEDSPVGCFTVLPLTGFRQPGPTFTKWWSLVDRLTDPQKWNNVMLSLLIRHLQVNPKGVLIVERGLFRNRNEALEQFTAPGGVVEVERGKLSSGNPPFQFSAGGPNQFSGMVQSLMEMYQSAIPRLAGFNAGALGQLGPDLRRISGSVVQSVQEAAMASNAELFDSLRLYRRQMGRVVLGFLNAFFEMDDIIRIVGDDIAYQDVIDPDTGQATPDPNNPGQNIRQMVLPPKEMWNDSAWAKISVEETTPAGDALQDLWQSLTQSGALQILMQPQQATGQPILMPQDLVEVIPNLPESLRNQMRQRIKAELRQMQAQQQAQAQQGQQQQNGSPLQQTQ